MRDACERSNEASLAQALFTWRYVPETRNRTLEEIERHWSGAKEAT